MAVSDFQDPKRLISRYVGTNFTFMINVVKESRQLRKEKRKKTQKEDEDCADWA